MPDLRVSGRSLVVEAGANLLDSLLRAGVPVAYSCRAGSCHACLVRCLTGTLLDNKPHALSTEQLEQRWRLACQCAVVENTSIEVFDPAQDALPARVISCDWPAQDVLLLRLRPERALRYRAGQHVSLCALSGVIRPYSVASLPAEDEWLEFHIDCSRDGAFASVARQLSVGDELRIGQLHGAALHYDPEWQSRPLLLMASGTGLAPLYSVLREAIRNDHQGAVRLLHVARDAASHYLRDELKALEAIHSNLQVELIVSSDLTAALAELRLVPRQSIALLCGHPDNVESFARRLYLAGLPRSQIFADSFLPHA
ncbi:iron-sulfur-binding ferredoxin reductase [Ectopseudomonas mendocina]|uniref:Iron-sulfur-binding ferredoxin reductase n=1 Tax=Ectopseudomonas mendocina TaxID=300 RepID=A0ABZ2RLL1_ECTME